MPRTSSEEYCSVKKMKKKIAVAVVFLYAVTWVGGWITHSRELKARARQMYAEAEKQDRELAELSQKEGLGSYDTSGHLRKNGPSTCVTWCVPLLPGVLLADSWYVIGPLVGRGGMKIVLYYGFGAIEIVCLSGWIS